MSNPGSDDLLARWQAGDPQAAAEMFQRYARRLIALARSRLSTKVGRRIDAEDVVQSAYRSFFAKAGRYTVERGHDLWQLLVTFTVHKLHAHVRRLQTGKRAALREQQYGSEESLLGLRPELLAREPSPVEAVALTEELEQLLRPLGPLERQMVELRLQGYGLDEIAVRVDRCERTVRRVLDEVKRQLRRDDSRPAPAPLPRSRT